MDPTCDFNFFTFFERILYKSNCIIFIFSWCRTHTKIRSKLVVIVTAWSQKITLWGPQRTPLGILRVKEDRRVTLDATATKLGIRHGAVQEMTGSLDYRKKGHPYSTIMLDLTLLFWPWKKMRTWGGKFSLTLRTVLIWHPSITISLVLWRIRCEANIKRWMRQSRQLCVNVFGQLEWSSTAREYSNFQNVGKNVYRETGNM